MSRTKKAFRLWNRDGTFYYRIRDIPGWRSTGKKNETAAENYVASILGTVVPPTSRNSDNRALSVFLEPDFTEACPHVARLRLEKCSIGERHIIATRRKRTVPLPVHTAAALKRYQVGREHVLPNAFVACDEQGHPLRYWRVWKAFRDGITTAGFGGGGLRIHDLRHALMTHLAEAGYSAEKSRVSFGWTTAQVQAGYTHLQGEALRGQADIVDRLFGGTTNQS
jgi:hypothetical protein